SLIGRKISVLPSHFRLIWETGELDPVSRELTALGRPGGGREIWEAESDSESESEESGEGSDEDDAGEQKEQEGGGGPRIRGAKGRGKKGKGEKAFDPRKWVRRETELVEGTRALGYWIEGREAIVRVEVTKESI
ncbi:MAG: hypothetical protein LQ340_007598, partial [Diploschistes diacapsis]